MKTTKVYVEGRGYVDIAKSILDKLSPAVQTFAKAAGVKAAEVGGDKLGVYVANKVADRALPQNPAALRAIEDIEAKIKTDIDTFTGQGFKLYTF